MLTRIARAGLLQPLYRARLPRPDPGADRRAGRECGASAGIRGCGREAERAAQDCSVAALQTVDQVDRSACHGMIVAQFEHVGVWTN
jgi:hypothetical protein